MDTSPSEGADFAVGLGSALVGTGAPVDLVERILLDVSARYRIEFKYSILPTGLIALGRDGNATVASIASSDPATLRFDQTTALFRLVDEARHGRITPAAGLEQLRDIEGYRRRFGRSITLAGHAMLTLGLAMLLDPSWQSLGVVGALGVLVGIMKLATFGHTTLVKLLPAAAAFTVALSAFLLRRYGFAVDGPQTIIPPLVTFLPGAMLTVGAMELADGSIVTGSSRLIAGLLQLLLLALGILVAASLVKVPASVGLLSAGTPRMGAWAPWVGVGLFGVGTAVFFSAFVDTYLALLSVLYAAFCVQYLTSDALGGFLSGFLAAATAVLAASILARHFRGPPVLVTFLPAFWLLVPGVLSLVGITRLAAGDAASEDISTALFTILAIALGVIAGLGLDRFVAPRLRWW